MPRSAVESDSNGTPRFPLSNTAPAASMLMSPTTENTDPTPSRWRRVLRGEPMRAVLSELRPIDWLFAVVPCAVFAALLVTCWVMQLDLVVSSWFYCDQTECWPLKHTQPFAWCYHNGCTPAILLGATGLTLGILALVIQPLSRVRKPGLFLGLTLAIGPGILVNAVLKPNIARPRPYQTTVFGGQEQFAYSGSMSLQGSRSFPSGHASMGFFFMTPALLFYRRRPGLASVVFFLGMAYGLLIGAARIVQGAHFTSDVVGSALCVYGTGVAVLFVRACLKQLDATTEANSPKILTISPKSGSARHAA